MTLRSIDELERATAQGWQAPVQEWLGGWLLRAADGFTGRANSALAVGDPGAPLGEAVHEVRAWYRARGLPAMIAVAYPTGKPEASGLDRFLAGHGWAVRSGAAVVMTAHAAALAPAGVDAALRVEMSDQPGDEWLSRYHYRGAEQLPAVARHLLCSAPWQAFGAVQAGGRTVAIGRVAVSGEWAGLTAIEVDPAWRRRGLGAAITSALAALAAERGARGVYLQVAVDNEPARALYRRAGFTDHHGYHYRVEP